MTHLKVKLCLLFLLNFFFSFQKCTYSIQILKGQLMPDFLLVSESETDYNVRAACGYPVQFAKC